MPDQKSLKRKKIFTPISLVVLLITFCGIWLSYFSPDEKHMEVTYFDVGQGDSAFIRFPNGKNALVDGGPGKEVLESLGRKLPFYDRDIDVIFLSHSHADHMVGLIHVLKRYKVGRVVVTAATYKTPGYQEFLELVKDKKIPVTVARRDVAFDFGEGAKVKVLHPRSAEKYENPNDWSEVLLLTLGQNEFLFTGDIEKEASGAMLDIYKNLEADVVKVPHHGSKDALNERLYKYLTPEYAIISVGEKNRYGHPSLKTIGLLEKNGIKYFRTDKEGDISLASDGENIKVK